MVEDQIALPDVAVERERQVDDRILQALGGPHREHLHGAGVAVEAAAAFGGTALLLALPAQPVAQGGKVVMLAVRDILEQLGDVGQVGHVAFAALPGQHAPAHALQLGGLEDGGDTAVARMSRPLPQRLGDLVGEGVAALGEIGGGLAEEHGRRRGAHHARAVRLVERLEQRQPVRRRLGFEHIGITGVDGLDPDFGQGLEAGVAVAVLLHDDRDVTRRDAVSVEGGAAVEQGPDVGGQVLADVLPQVVDRYGLNTSAPERLPRDHSEAERVVARRPGQPAARVSRLDLVNDDARVAELGAFQHHLQAVDEGRVAAPVGHQCPLLASGFGGFQVGDDVAAAEGVDRLLRVADEDQGGAAGEGAVDDLPLDRVGVLELVDHHNRPAGVHPEPGRGVGLVERVGQPGQQIVVAEDAAPPLARLQLPDHVADEPKAHGGPGIRIGLGGPQLGGGVVDHLPGEFERFGVGQLRIVAVPAEVRQVEVVDDLGDKVVQALHQLDPGIAVPGHAERLEHQVAELVGGGDGGGVERGERIAQPGLALLEFFVGAREQVLNHLVVADHRAIIESPYRLDDLGPDPLAQFLGGRAAERDEQHLVQGGPAFGQIAGDQTGERERLAGTGAGLQHGRRSGRRQRPQQVERLHQTLLPSARSIGSHSLAA